MPEEPLVVLHTALMKDITPSINHILGPEGNAQTIFEEKLLLIKQFDLRLIKLQVLTV